MPSSHSPSLSDLLAWHLGNSASMIPPTPSPRAKGKGKRRDATPSGPDPTLQIGQSSFREAKDALSDRDQRQATWCRRRLESFSFYFSSTALEEPVVGEEVSSPDLQAIQPPEDPFYFSLLDQQPSLTSSQGSLVPGLSPPPSSSSSSSPLAPPQVDRDWFMQQCQAHLDSFSSSDEPMSLSRLSTHLLTLLRSSRSDDDIQSELVDLLGYDFDLLSLLLKHRSELLKNLSEKGTLDSLFQPEPTRSTPPSRIESPARHGSDPVNRHMGNFTISSQSQKESEKALRKEKKRLQQAKAFTSTELEEEESVRLLHLDPSELRRAREEQLQLAANAPLASSSTPLLSNQPNYPHVYSSKGKASGPISSFASQYILPVGTERFEHRDHEELIIPARERVQDKEGQNGTLVQVKEMDNLCRPSLPGYQTLNPVQSRVYEMAYKTVENLLICAPTGAGKTEIALLSILRTIYSYCSPPPSPLPDAPPLRPNQVDLTAFKVVYVAPMKALASEIVRKMTRRLSWLGVRVKELTGDMQLSRQELRQTQVIVTTPEKWDVVTRKGSGSGGSEAGGGDWMSLVRLLILDEVHLLNDERGAVLEGLVARTLRQVESSQSMIRIVGLSATLPNYVDVAEFLRVNPYRGMFYFDDAYRPVGLEQHLIGVKAKPGSYQATRIMDQLTYDRCVEYARMGKQTMVFVHTRKDTLRMAKVLREMAAEEGEEAEFRPGPPVPPDQEGESPVSQDDAKGRKKGRGSSGGRGKGPSFSSGDRSTEMKELLDAGFATHHAGMGRVERREAERLFESGDIRVLCCTSTLAWGVNLPAYAVVIHGTQVYDSQKGKVSDLSILDVLQVFGRAGRPQFESYGVGHIITTHDKLAHYTSALTRQHPVESHFGDRLTDMLNAEICLGTVGGIDDAVQWLGYTFLHVRMQRRPFSYGLPHDALLHDPALKEERLRLIEAAANKLHDLGMTLYTPVQGSAGQGRGGSLMPTALGRIASTYYLDHATASLFWTTLRPGMTEADVLALISRAGDFSQVLGRQEETKELKRLYEVACACAVPGMDRLRSQAPSMGGGKGKVGVKERGQEEGEGVSGEDKVNILLQTHISREIIRDGGLASEGAYVVKCAGRMIRGLLEMAMKGRLWSATTCTVRRMALALDRRQWAFESALAQGAETSLGRPLQKVLQTLEQSTHRGIEGLRGLDAKGLEKRMSQVSSGPVGAVDVSKTLKAISRFPGVALTLNSPKPLSPHLLQLEVTLDPQGQGKAKDSGHGWWVWVEMDLEDDEEDQEEEDMSDDEEEEEEEEEEELMDHPELPSQEGEILWSEYVLMDKGSVHLEYLLPLPRPGRAHRGYPRELRVRALSDAWLGAASVRRIKLGSGTRAKVIPPRDPGPLTLPRPLISPFSSLPLSIVRDPWVESIISSRKGQIGWTPLEARFFHTLYHTSASLVVGAPLGSDIEKLALLSVYREWRLVQEEESRKEVMEKPKVPEARLPRVIWIVPTSEILARRWSEWKADLYSHIPDASSNIGYLDGMACELRKGMDPWVSPSFLLLITPSTLLHLIHRGTLRSDMGSLDLMVAEGLEEIGEGNVDLELVIPRAIQCLSPSRTLLLSAPSHGLLSMADTWTPKALFSQFDTSSLTFPRALHIKGVPGKWISSREVQGVRPLCTAIRRHAPFPEDRVVVAVGSRSAAYLTGSRMITELAGSEFPLNQVSQNDLEEDVAGIHDVRSRALATLGIAVVHGDLSQQDQSILLALYSTARVRVLIATRGFLLSYSNPLEPSATVLVVKGVEWWDSKSSSVRMIGPERIHALARVTLHGMLDGGYDEDRERTMCVLVPEEKKSLYRHLLESPLSVESSLSDQVVCKGRGDDQWDGPGGDAFLREVLAQIKQAQGKGKVLQGLFSWLESSFLGHRLFMNPSFYRVDDVSADGEHVTRSELLERLIYRALMYLKDRGCLLEGPGQEKYEGMELTDRGKLLVYHGMSPSTPHSWARILLGEEKAEMDEVEMRIGKALALTPTMRTACFHREIQERRKEGGKTLSKKEVWTSDGIILDTVSNRIFRFLESIVLYQTTPFLTHARGERWEAGIREEVQGNERPLEVIVWHLWRMVDVLVVEGMGDLDLLRTILSLAYYLEAAMVENARKLGPRKNTTKEQVPKLASWAPGKKEAVIQLHQVSADKYPRAKARLILLEDKESGLVKVVKCLDESSMVGKSDREGYVTLSPPPPPASSSRKAWRIHVFEYAGKRGIIERYTDLSS
ncbi:MAG: hypothetical protein DHS80DRAFT_26255 [Piptocephalis tieghemiana]|nr:MAG: hypothetical protein DHS80DRAFT_26255 [Piptocephalis tieghemiana]